MPAGQSNGRSRRSSPRAQRRAERRKRLRRTILLGSAAVVVLSATAYTLLPEADDAKAVAGRAAAQPDPTAGESADTSGNAVPQGGQQTPSPQPSSPPAASPPGSPTPSPAAPTPARPGTFKTSAAAGKAQGKGPARRWRIEVEEGSGVDPESAARSVEAILGDPRGWTKDPKYGFQLVAAGQPVDFTIKIATPKTTDLLCDVVTPELIGETNCSTGHTVVVNLKRWQEGSPQFNGSPEEYRALIINHEVGHELGRGHESCPAPGKPAPAMMQQIKGLLGCKSNAWPYDSDGTYLSGPPVL
ncbi:MULTISPECIES: DUF3152 domain-containing protein [Streptomyces]|uniref:DUF3152 domain-containing protein n=1 Tax=Streptomyces spororaveus TaxID=284039 RepID=A0ABQ3TDF9_9ACTN|nr:DUF3152 domain-containing protein [Streptomyces spororaveus]MCM9081148.1 DUF3152 domain-containing protein [Streptomyces spororaveus]GHI78458.1 hypothetical protein Sspor_40190 [Streptomyces spororaveus]